MRRVVREAVFIGLCLAALTGCSKSSSIGATPASVPAYVDVTDTCRVILQAALDANAALSEAGTDTSDALGVLLRASADLRAAMSSGYATPAEGGAARQLAQAYDEFAAGLSKGEADTSMFGSATDALVAACGDG